MLELKENYTTAYTFKEAPSPAYAVLGGVGKELIAIEWKDNGDSKELFRITDTGEVGFPQYLLSLMSLQQWSVIEDLIKKGNE